MRVREIAAVAGMLVLAAMSGTRAQQASSGQDDQSAPTRQTTSADWSSTGNGAPEQAGDLYQAKGRDSGSFGGPAAPDNTVLPGALTPGVEPLNGNGRNDPRE